MPTPKLKYRRVLLKLSGEALMGSGNYGIDPAVLEYLAGEIKGLVTAGVQTGIVIGAGNISRGASLADQGMARVTGDHIGMLATVINSLALQDTLERHGLSTRLMSALAINAVCEEYQQRRAIRHLQHGRVVIFSAGTGNPLFTTDSAASLRAIEIDADLMIKATKVDGVYSADPMLDANAARYTHLDYDRVLAKRLAVMDATAVVLCRDHHMHLRVLDMNQEGALLAAVRGEAVGTLIDGNQ